MAPCNDVNQSYRHNIKKKKSQTQNHIQYSFISIMFKNRKPFYSDRAHNRAYFWKEVEID